MTLIVSVRVPDGIIIAADSVSSISAMGQSLTAKGKTKCPNCGKEHDFAAPIQVPLGPGITSTLPYSQKLQPLWNRFGVGTHGTGILGNKSIFSIVREFENTTNNTSLPETAKKLSQHLHKEVKKIPGFKKIPNNVFALGFQIVGYHEDKLYTISVDIGKEIQSTEWIGFGTTTSGYIIVATKLWELKGMGPELGQPYQAWSIQDAADYSEFLIETTAKYQRFANVIPTVGGDIDIGIVLPSNRFKWMRRKQLASLLIAEED